MLDVFDDKTIVQRMDAFDDLIGSADRPAPIEVAFDRETRVAGVHGLPITPLKALEIWTQNKIYVIDSTMACVEIQDRATGEPLSKSSSILGARLAGGQRQYGKTIHLSRPFPVPGTQAVFQRPPSPRPVGVTTKVERVVLRIQVTSYVLEQQGAWDDVTSALLLPDE